MAQISRLKDAEISNGNLINADDIDAELNQLVSQANSQDTEVTAIGTGTYTFSGVKTFSSTPKTNAIDERTAASGVTVDSVLLKDGAIRVPGSAGYTPATNGDLGYDSTSHTYDVYVNGAAKYLIHSGNVQFPKGYIGMKAPTYTSAATITIPTGVRARSSDDTANIEVGSDITLSLATSGAAGLDTGAEASSTWYYVYLIKKSSDGTVSAVFSVTNENVSGSITFPSGYDLKRQLPIAVRNDGSSNIVPFGVGAGWPYRPYIFHQVAFLPGVSGPNVTNFANAVTPATYTAYSTAAYIPPISRAGIFQVSITTASTIRIRKGGDSLEGFQIDTPANTYGFLTPVIQTDSSQQVEIKRTSGTGSVYADVVGYIVTEM